jgi:hypothetical protein
MLQLESSTGLEMAAQYAQICLKFLSDAHSLRPMIFFCNHSLRPMIFKISFDASIDELIKKLVNRTAHPLNLIQLIASRTIE